MQAHSGASVTRALLGAQLQAVRNFMKDTTPIGVPPQAPQEETEPEEELDVTEEEEEEEVDADVEEEDDAVEAEGLMHQ